MQGEWQLDVDLLELQHELLSFLSEHDVIWFEDFTRVEADLGNGELKVYLTCPYKNVQPILQEFARMHGFPRLFYSADKGAAYLRRR